MPGSIYSCEFTGDDAYPAESEFSEIVKNLAARSAKPSYSPAPYSPSPSFCELTPQNLAIFRALRFFGCSVMTPGCSALAERAKSLLNGDTSDEEFSRSTEEAAEYLSRKFDYDKAKALIWTLDPRWKNGLSTAAEASELISEIARFYDSREAGGQEPEDDMP